MNNSSKKAILNLAIILFLGLSTYTTQVGVSLIWQSGSETVRFLISWILAIATSLLLYYISSIIVEFIKRKQAIRLVFGYFSIATLSVFFNFNAFYSGQIKNTSLEIEVTEVREKTVSLLSEGKNDLLEGINLKKSVVDSLRAEMKAEEEHPYRSGRGNIYQSIRRKHDVLAAQLESDFDNFSKIENQIDSIYENSLTLLDSSLNDGNEELLEYAVKYGLKSYSSIKSILRSKTNKLYPNIEKQTSVDRPDFALTVLINYFSGNGSYTEEEKSTIFISIFFSVILDFPIFFLLVILNLPGRRRKDDNPFGDIDTEKRSHNIHKEAEKTFGKKNKPKFDDETWEF